MSRDNVEIVRSVYEALSRRDGVTPFELYASDIELDIGSRLSQLGLERTYRGHEGVRQFWRDLLAVFRDLHLELEELIEVDAGVRAAVHEHNVGRISGVAVVRRHFAAWAGRDGKVVRVRIFDERSEAERAGGVRK